MMNINVLNRLFHINYNGRTGTAFTIEKDSRQYLVTARHVIKNFTSGQIGVAFDGNWVDVQFKLVGHSEKENDISVLSSATFLKGSVPVSTSMDGIILGQQVYFLGYPYGRQMDAVNLGEQLGSYPYPYVKSGVISSMQKDGKIFVDGHNNPGFSGGPVVFAVNGDTKKLRIAGVVSSYPTYLEPVVDVDGNEKGLFIKNNPGILIANDIRFALELIDRNPIGLPILIDDKKKVIPEYE